VLNRLLVTSQRFPDPNEREQISGPRWQNGRVSKRGRGFRKLARGAGGIFEASEARSVPLRRVRLD
jgi:hypothetical protein